MRELTDDEVAQLVDDLRKPVFILNMAKPGLPGAAKRRANACALIRAALAETLDERASS